ncbi:MAG: 2-phospho-L-lactate transferase CofD family protein [Candidatus Daviesbacteria bacterium]|nr:2-phospho-L-lactate transferase CofD family protein [Candidatus Daviesbacteria bacterium]
MSEHVGSNIPPKIVLFQGGHGGRSLRQGLRAYLESQEVAQVTVVGPTTDSGGSAGRLKDDHKTMAVTDVFQAMSDFALNPHDAKLLSQRFIVGNGGSNGLNGHRAINLMFAGAVEVFENDPIKALEYLTNKFPLIPNVRVYPVTSEWDLELIYSLEGGGIIPREHLADDRQSGPAIKGLELSNNKAQILEPVKEAITLADMVVFGPGTLHGSICSQLLIQGVPQALQKSRAINILFSNIFNQQGQTDGYDLFKYGEVIERLVGRSLDYYTYFTQKVNGSFYPEVVSFYQEYGQDLVRFDPSHPMASKVRSYDLVTKSPGLSKSGKEVELLRHTPEPSAAALMDIWRVHTRSVAKS